jgi:hypothetical protein
MGQVIRFPIERARAAAPVVDTRRPIHVDLGPAVATMLPPNTVIPDPPAPPTRPTWTLFKPLGTYKRERPIAEIARCVRAEIRTCIVMGLLPPMKVKVTYRSGRGMNRDHVNVTIERWESSVRFMPERFARWLLSVRAGGSSHQPAGVERYTPLARLILHRLDRIVAAYGYDRSDPMTDYWDVAFWSDVKIDHAEEGRLAQRDAGTEGGS